MYPLAKVSEMKIEMPLMDYVEKIRIRMFG